MPVVVQRQVLWSRRCRTPSGGAALAVYRRVDCVPVEPQRQIPTVLSFKTKEIPLTVRQLGGRCPRVVIPRVQFSDEVMISVTGAVVQTVQTVWKCRSRSYSSGRRLTCCGAEANPHGFGEIPQLPYTWWLMSLLCSCNRCHKCSSVGVDVAVWASDSVTDISVECV